MEEVKCNQPSSRWMTGLFKVLCHIEGLTLSLWLAGKLSIVVVSRSVLFREIYLVEIMYFISVCLEPFHKIGMSGEEAS